MADPTILSILDRPDLRPTAAAWQWDQWARAQGHTLAQVEHWLATTHLARLGPPQCFILLDGTTPAGMATLEFADLDARPDLSPWLANLYVDPAHRGRGHAIRLVHHVESAARTAGIKTLYLHTNTAAPLYTRLGWQPISEEPHHDDTVTVMQRDLS